MARHLAANQVPMRQGDAGQNKLQIRVECPQNLQAPLAQVSNGLEAMLRSTAAEARDLREKNANLQREGMELEKKNEFLTHQLNELKAAAQVRRSQPPPAVTAPNGPPLGSPHGQAAAQAANQAQEAEADQTARLNFSAARIVEIHDMPVHSVAMVPKGGAGNTGGLGTFASASWRSR